MEDDVLNVEVVDKELEVVDVVLVVEDVVLVVEDVEDVVLDVLVVVLVVVELVLVVVLVVVLLVEKVELVLVLDNVEEHVEVLDVVVVLHALGYPEGHPDLNTKLSTSTVPPLVPLSYAMISILSKSLECAPKSLTSPIYQELL